MKNLFFIHIPKTAGTTMMTALKEVYGNGLYRISNQINSDPCWNQGLPSSTSCLTGHVSSATADLLDFQAPTVMFARDPLDRIPSLYHYIKRRGNKHSAFHHVKDRTLEEFVVGRVVAGTNNGMVRYLSGMAIGVQPFDRHVEESDYNVARMNMEKMAFVGLTSRFDESLKRMADLLDWPTIPVYKSYLVNREKRSLTSIQTQAITAFNEYDQRLYQDAIEMFWS